MSELVVTPSDYMIVFGVLIFVIGVLLIGLAVAVKIIMTIVDELGKDEHERSNT